MTDPDVPNRSAPTSPGDCLPSVLSTIRDAVIVIDAEGRITLWNTAAEKVSGCSAENAVGRPLEQVLSTVPPIGDVIAEKPEESTGFCNLLHVQRPGGTSLEADLSWCRLSDTGGHVLTLRDLTHLRSAERNLRESEALYESLVETLPMCILRKDLEGRFTFANRAFLNLAGKSLDELVGKTDFDLYERDMATKYRQDDARVLASQEVFEDVEIHREEDGVTRYVQVLKSGVRDRSGNAIGVQVVFWDITDKRRAEQALQESEERFRHLADNVRDIFWVRNASTGSVLYVNPAFEQVWGISAEALGGNPLVWLDYVHPSDRPMVQENYERLGEVDSFDIEYRIIHENRRVRWIRDRGFAVRREDDTPFRLVGVAEDITDRKEAERAVKEKNRDLETLLYVTSHDLREPLRAIENFSRLVLDRCGAQMDEKSRDFQARVIRAATRLDQLLGDVLILSRAQRMMEPSDEVPAAELVSEAIKQLDGKIHQTGAKVVVKPNLPVMRVDRRWAIQAIVNLLANALKFTKPGEAPDVEVDATTVVRGGLPQIAIVVRDRGPGVSSDHAERIFQLFQRAVGREVEGTGAGLAIVRQIAERHGGYAWVESRVGGGSQFYLSFGPHGVADDREPAASQPNSNSPHRKSPT